MHLPEPNENPAGAIRVLSSSSPDVTLEDDLARRDLTINAIAEDDSGNLIDPFHGEADIKAGILRHVSPAFVEDPLRVLRVARFAARFGFKVAPNTMKLMKEISQSGELETLVPERVWTEIEKSIQGNILVGLYWYCAPAVQCQFYFLKSKSYLVFHNQKNIILRSIVDCIPL